MTKKLNSSKKNGPGCFQLILGVVGLIIGYYLFYDKPSEKSHKSTQNDIRTSKIKKVDNINSNNSSEIENKEVEINKKNEYHKLKNCMRPSCNNTFSYYGWRHNNYGCTEATRNTGIYCSEECCERDNRDY